MKRPPSRGQVRSAGSFVRSGERSTTSVTGALRMVFVRYRRTEQGKDSVTQGLGHIAVIAMHGIHHQL